MCSIFVSAQLSAIQVLVYCFYLIGWEDAHPVFLGQPDVIFCILRSAWPDFSWLLLTLECIGIVFMYLEDVEVGIFCLHPDWGEGES